MTTNNPFTEEQLDFLDAKFNEFGFKILSSMRGGERNNDQLQNDLTLILREDAPDCVQRILSRLVLEFRTDNELSQRLQILIQKL